MQAAVQAQPCIVLRVISEETLYHDKQRQLKRVDKGLNMTFRVAHDTKMSALMNAFCEKQSLSRASVQFIFSGCTLKDMDTVKSLNMKSEDIIYVSHSDSWKVVPPPQVSNDMRDLYEAIGNCAPLVADNNLDVGADSDLVSSLCDCRFVVGPDEVELKAHRAILVARSPKLRALFNWHSENKQSGEVRIPNHSPFVFDLMLEFIYSGEFNAAKCEKEFARLQLQHGGGGASQHHHHHHQLGGGLKRAAPADIGAYFSRKRARQGSSRDIELVSSGEPSVARSFTAPAASQLGARIGGAPPGYFQAPPFHSANVYQAPPQPQPGLHVGLGSSPVAGARGQHAATGVKRENSPRASNSSDESKGSGTAAAAAVSSSPARGRDRADEDGPTQADAAQPVASSSSSSQQTDANDNAASSSSSSSSSSGPGGTTNTAASSAQQGDDRKQPEVYLGPSTLAVPQLPCDLPLQLLVVADEYLLPRLKTLIEEYLIKTVNNVREAVSCFCAADRFKAPALKTSMKQWLLDNFDDVNSSQDAQVELQRCPDLLMELTQRAVAALRPPRPPRAGSLR